MTVPGTLLFPWFLPPTPPHPTLPPLPAPSGSLRKERGNVDWENAALHLRRTLPQSDRARPLPIHRRRRRHRSVVIECQAPCN